jgi:3',5'-cyclic AMP phosphodiesterase CpdA
VTTILQVSDPHFGTEKLKVVDALVALRQELAPDLLVLSGDITQRARRDQFAAAASFTRRMAVPSVLAIPGNHDVPLFNVLGRCFAPYAEYGRVFGRDLEPTWTAADCVVVGVKTTRRYRHVNGEISREQRERVARAARTASSAQLRVAVVHQPVAVPRASEEHNVAYGSDAAVRAWAEAGIDVILAGHIHLPFVLPLHEVMSGLSKPIWAVNAGTAVSSRVRYDAGNSVNVLRTSSETGPRCFVVEHWGYSDTKSAFLCAARVRCPA